MPGFFNPKKYDKGGAGPQRIPQCGKCGLLKDCTSPKLQPTGKGKIKILFIGDAPSATDDKYGDHFTSEHGNWFRGIVEDMGYDLEDCHMTTAIICYPKKTQGKVEPYMAISCRPSVYKAIKECKPNVIVPFGTYALEAVLNGIWGQKFGQFKRWVGWAIPVAKYDAWVCPTYHPSHIKQNDKDPSLLFAFKEHLKQIFDLQNVKPKPLNIDDLEKKVEIILDVDKAKARLLDLAKKKGTIAWDYETTGLKPHRKVQKIVSVSFCLNGKDTFAFMMHPKLVKALKKVLRAKELRKVASNLKFEEQWTIVKLNIKVRNWHWDTMLVAHEFDNRSGITSVKFQAFVLLGIGDYDSHLKPYLTSKTANGLNNIYQIDTKELLMYNGLDSLLEYKVMRRQKKMMGLK